MKRTVLFWAAALLMGCVAVLPAGAQSKGFKLGQWVEIHNALLRELNRNYVDTLPLDRMHRKGIEAMLEELDPYTEYVPSAPSSSSPKKTGMSSSTNPTRIRRPIKTDWCAGTKSWPSTG